METEQQKTREKLASLMDRSEGNLRVMRRIIANNDFGQNLKALDLFVFLSEQQGGLGQEMMHEIATFVGERTIAEHQHLGDLTPGRQNMAEKYAALAE